MASSSTSKQIMIKLIGAVPPRIVQLTSIELGGVWLQDKDLALELTKIAGQEELQVFLGNAPVVFVPLSQVQWIMSAD